MLISIRNAILISLLALVSSNAMAEWVKLGSNETDTLYADLSTIRGTDTLAKMWALNDYKESQRVNERDSAKSTKVEYEYDCKGQQTRMLYYTAYSESMAEGDIVDFNVAPSDWMRVSPNTGQEQLWKIACREA